MKAIVPTGVGMTDIYKAIIPFVLLQALCLLIIILFPQIALWLPRLIIN
jgi:TRAP-type mannitol/chloroaromatic compound transport system permease large subunit